jgi:DNA-binding CsgD family transcriptional regulator
VERDEALELAVRTLLQRLSTTERAVFVLREAFDYPYRQIADLLELSEANARQHLLRARVRLSDERRLPASCGESRRLVAAFITDTQTGDLAPLEQLLAGDGMARAPLAIAA